MPFADLHGIRTRYEILGDGPPLLMFSPGGFNGALENWTSFGIYQRLNLLEHLSERYTCITFDKRESGRSGGRVERITWGEYAAQGVALLDELGIDRAHLMGGCIGCSIAITFAVSQPQRVSSMVLYSPAGGPKYRRIQLARFAEHLVFVSQEGLEGVAVLARSDNNTFAQDPRVGPWASVLRLDSAFADQYAQRDVGEYWKTVDEMGSTLFDRDTVPGPDPEQLFELELPALVVPGHDASHATSSARYLEECLERSEYWDLPVAEQTEETAPPRVLEFLDAQPAISALPDDEPDAAP